MKSNWVDYHWGVLDYSNPSKDKSKRCEICAHSVCVYGSLFCRIDGGVKVGENGGCVSKFTKKPVPKSNSNTGSNDV